MGLAKPGHVVQPLRRVAGPLLDMALRFAALDADLASLHSYQAHTTVV